MNLRIVFTAVLAAAACAAPACRGGEIAWRESLDFAAAAAEAERDGKLIHIFVEGDNCPPCDSFKRTHLSDPAYADYVSTLFVNLRAHEGVPADRAFLESLNLTHSAVPRFYVLTPRGAGVSMALGMVAVPPMEGVEVLAMAAGKELPVDREAAAALASRLRNYAASFRAAGTAHPDNPLRPVGVAALEAQAWALAGRLDEAMRAFGSEWVPYLGGQEVRNWYSGFWVAWRSNLPGALAAAEMYHGADPDDPNGWWLMGRALAANGRFAEAARHGGRLAAENPGNARLIELVEDWRRSADR